MTDTWDNSDVAEEYGNHSAGWWVKFREEIRRKVLNDDHEWLINSLAMNKGSPVIFTCKTCGVRVSLRLFMDGSDDVYKMYFDAPKGCAIFISDEFDLPEEYTCRYNCVLDVVK